MTPTYDLDTLFLAPPARRDAETAERTQRTADDRDDAMRALRNPFAIRAEPAGVFID